ncbi:MAG: ankyrin repeat domain-containing protein [Candidatus Babeliales bacterium]|jgi:ankyrin repeat protein
MLTRINAIVLLFQACMVSLAGMDSVEPSDIESSDAIIFAERTDEEADADLWQAHFCDALTRKDKTAAFELLNVHNQVAKSPDLTRFTDEDGRTFLILAVGLKSLKIVQMILRRVEPKLVNNYVNYADSHGWTALDYATFSKCMRILCFLSKYANVQVCCTACDRLLLLNEYYKGYVHINRRRKPLCLSELSGGDPSDDEDVSTPTSQASPTSSTSSDDSMTV